MHARDENRLAVPLPDIAGGGFFCLLGAGWLFVNDANPAQALALATVTTLAFWAPLRLMDFLHHGRLRPNGVLALAVLRANAPPARKGVTLAIRSRS